MAAVAGVDGARGGWLMAIADSVSPGAAQLVHHEHFEQVVEAAEAAGCVVVGVDMPISLATSEARASDGLARAILGRRRSALFPTPAESVLDARSYVDAQRLNRASLGKGMSKQAWNLLPMIRQIRGCVTPNMAHRFVEVHPETSFTVMVGEPLESKKTARGVGQRLDALGAHFDGLAGVIAGAPLACAIDDVLDALAIVWSVRRHVLGTSTVLGTGRDAAGYPQEIVA